MSEITGLLLAAGSGSRFGGNKLLAELKGKPLILHAAASLSPCDHLIAVVRKEDRSLQQILQAADIPFVINPEAEQGMGRSIACGVKASVKSAGWCILPADMPWVRQATTQRIVDALRRGAPLTAPFYQGERGHPVGFGREYQAPLLALQGDSGAREILKVGSDELSKVQVVDPGILVDIDEPCDLSDYQ